MTYRIVESLYCTPETHVTLYVNFTGIKILNLIKNANGRKIKKGSGAVPDLRSPKYRKAQS